MTTKKTRARLQAEIDEVLASPRAKSRAPSRQPAAGSYQSMGSSGGSTPAWLGKLEGARGVYAIRDVLEPGVAYVGSSDRDLRSAILRHFPEGRPGRRGPGSSSARGAPAYRRNSAMVAVWEVDQAGDVVATKAGILGRLRPRDNHVGLDAGLDEG